MCTQKPVTLYVRTQKLQTLQFAYAKAVPTLSMFVRKNIVLGYGEQRWGSNREGCPGSFDSLDSTGPRNELITVPEAIFEVAAVKIEFHRGDLNISTFFGIQHDFGISISQGYLQWRAPRLNRNPNFFGCCSPLPNISYSLRFVFFFVKTTGQV